ncbi:hypothetical protein [Fusobacterium perfoetens]|uniref:hypothetical protein n=1 Tax=Fusobacterium perfoetens TaxID=852 RepID=UPI000688391D|nr:hypothetical protein [Fusobacterium perfoetens]
MKKHLFLFLTGILILGGCEAPKSNKNIEITLTQEEIQNVKDDQNQAAAILVNKAISKEMSEIKYTDEELKELNELKENLEKEFFLTKMGRERAVVSDGELLSVYQENADKLEKLDPEIVLPQIREQLLIQKTNQEKINYVNSLVEKYDLNSKLKAAFPEVQNPENKVEDKKDEIVAKETTTPEKTETKENKKVETKKK